MLPPQANVIFFGCVFIQDSNVNWAIFNVSVTLPVTLSELKRLSSLISAKNCHQTD